MQGHLANRKYFLGGMVILIALIFIIKLMVLQLLSPKYKLSANSNSRHRQVEYPARGLIFDRGNNVMAYNQAAYELMLIPRQLESFDTVEMCQMLEVNQDKLIEGINKAKSYSASRPSRVIGQISAKQYAQLQEKLFKYPGFFVQSHAQRAYQDSIAPHVLGYVGEVSPDDLRRDRFYSTGDYLGASGLEQEYEKTLRGKKGVSYYLMDVYGHIQGSYKGSRFDTLPEPGKNITITLDAELQRYGEYLMSHKSGSIVAIEPKTGEVLAMVSSPGFDLSSFVGRGRSAAFEALRKDTLDPMFNRATMSRYAPGSIFKIVQALIALELGVINEDTGFPCNKNLIGCHNHPEATDVSKAIQYSCNPYFFEVYKRIIQPGHFRSIFKDSEAGIDSWREHVISFGLGVKLPIDLPNISSGFIPDAQFYDGWYGHGRWAFSTIYSNCNGQGEIETVPIQIANLAAILANRGYYIVPHFVKAIDGQDQIDDIYLERRYTSVSASYFDVVINAMYDVVWKLHGTGGLAQVPGISVCGKTGTVENDHGEDHSGFFAFAPKNNPSIAVAVYVENAGGGGSWAAPIASLMIEKYINGTITQKDKENRILQLRMY